MKKLLADIKAHTRRIPIRFALICLTVILPVNLLAVGFSSLLYLSYKDKIIANYQNQVTAHGNLIAQEMAQVEQSVRYLFTTGSFNRFAFEGISDPAVANVALKSILTKVQTDNTSRGISFVWDRNMNMVSVFHHNANYSLHTEEIIKAEILGRSEPGNFSSRRELICADELLFIGSSYNFKQYTIGICIDIGSQLEWLYSYAIEPRGTVLLLDENGNRLCSFSSQGFLCGDVGVQEDETPIFVLSEIDESGFVLAEYVEKSELWGIMRLYPAILFILILLTALSFFAVPIICRSFRHLFIRPITGLADAMESVSRGNLTVRLPEQEDTEDIEAINQHFNSMVQEIQSLRIQGYENEITRLKMEAINLKLQVNPHMYLNALNTIYSLASVGKTLEVCDFSATLMHYFRYIFRTDAEFASLEDEMGFVLSYVDIQKARFPERFTFGYAVEDTAKNLMIPRLVVENFVENAVKHGLCDDREIEVFVHAFLRDGFLHIQVMDDGRGIDDVVLARIRSDETFEDDTGKHTGIWNTRRRLSYYYNDRYEIAIHSVLNDGTRVELTLPAERRCLIETDI